MKKIAPILLMIFISFVSYPMEQVDITKEKLENVIQNNPNEVIDLAKNVVQNNNGNNDSDRHDDLRSSYPQSISPQSSPLNQPSPTSQIPRLNLNKLAKSKSSKVAPKTPITTHSQLTQQVGQAKKTYRQMLSDSNSQMNVNGKGDTEMQESGNMLLFSQKKSLLPRRLNNHDTVIDIAQGTVYTVAQVWDMLKSISPVLHQFGIDNDLPIDEVIMYGNLLNDMHVHPEALVQAVKNNCNVKLPDKKISVGEVEGVIKAQIQKYQKIKDKDPERYQAILLDAFKMSFAEQDGQTISSPFNDTHIQVLEKQAVNGESTIRYQYIALAVSTVLSLAGFAWGIYGQVTGTATAAPTHTPTLVPTGMPTFMPTGTPT